MSKEAVFPERDIKLVIWFAADKSQFLKKALSILDKSCPDLHITLAYQREIKVSYHGELLPCVHESEIHNLDYDVVLAAGAELLHNAQVVKRCESLGIEVEKLLLDRIPCTPGFTLKKYMALQRSDLSIFAAHCFGGILANRLGMPFNSPFINMFFSPMKGYLRFLQSPREYMAETPVFLRWEFEQNLRRDYPVVRLGDIEIHMNHYTDFETGLRKWEERKKRINWNNLFVTMYTDKPEEARAFSDLSYEKKACFTSFESDIEAAYCLPAIQEGEPTWERANALAFGRRSDYDVFEMLLNGRKVYLG